MIEFSFISACKERRSHSVHAAERLPAAISFAANKPFNSSVKMASLMITASANSFCFMGIIAAKSFLFSKAASSRPFAPPSPSSPSNAIRAVSTAPVRSFSAFSASLTISSMPPIPSFSRSSPYKVTSNSTILDSHSATSSCHNLRFLFPASYSP